MITSPRGVELGFRKSSFSSANDGDCVEVADQADGSRLLRDSKQGGAGPELRFTESEWAAFTKGVKAGEFD